jgi:hypothetical protein
MMNHFHRRSLGMSSQLSTYTTRKKIANVIVGKSTLPPVGRPVRGDRRAAPPAVCGCYTSPPGRDWPWLLGMLSNSSIEMARFKTAALEKLADEKLVQAQ